MKTKNKIIILSVIILSVIIFITAFNFISKKENEIEFKFYSIEEPYNNGEYYEITQEFSSIIDYDELRVLCNEKNKYELIEIDFSKQAYLVASGKKVKRIYYHYFDKVELLKNIKGYVLFIEYEDMPLSNEKYIYIIDNLDGPFCTEDERYFFSK